MEFAYSATEGLVLNEVAGGTVTMHVGDVWWADDPFVLARPDLFSSTPPIVHSTIGRGQPATTPLDARVELSVRGVMEDVSALARRTGRPRKLA